MSTRLSIHVCAAVVAIGASALLSGAAFAMRSGGEPPRINGGHGTKPEAHFKPESHPRPDLHSQPGTQVRPDGQHADLRKPINIDRRLFIRAPTASICSEGIIPSIQTTVGT